MAGDSSYVERKDGTPVRFNVHAENYDFKERREQLEVRVNDICALIKELHERPDYL